ncbi:hypothetical protein EV715DRAFT_200550, partial [Schizophyllum commune]
RRYEQLSPVPRALRPCRPRRGRPSGVQHACRHYRHPRPAYGRHQDRNEGILSISASFHRSRARKMTGQGHRCSVQAEVTNADKAANEKVGSSAIISILRKAIQRRTDAAAQYDAAARADLAEQERREAALLAELVPPLLPESAIDEKLREALAALPADTDARAKQGLLFKQFYAIVDKALVDPALVKKRAQAILASA